MARYLLLENSILSLRAHDSSSNYCASMAKGVIAQAQGNFCILVSICFPRMKKFRNSNRNREKYLGG
jgi:hypothetical protein